MKKAYLLALIFLTGGISTYVGFGIILFDAILTSDFGQTYQFVFSEMVETTICGLILAGFGTAVFSHLPSKLLSGVARIPVGVIAYAKK